MSKQLSAPLINFVRPWYFKRPCLYRYLNKEFVDAFFETGALRLSSFKEFSKHPSELCRDINEGAGVLLHRNSEGSGSTLMAKLSQGHEAYVLCASTIYHNNIMKKFKNNSGFKINDITSFANAISAHVRGFTAGIEGQCQYLSQRVIETDMGVIDIERMKISENEIDMHKMLGRVLEAAGDDFFFLKEDSFRDEYEYRLVWNTLSTAENYIDIKCPEAVQFCTRFEDLSTLT